MAIATSSLSNVYFTTDLLETDPDNPSLMTGARPRVAHDRSSTMTWTRWTIRQGAYGSILDVDQTPSACSTTVHLSFNGVVNVNATSGPLDIVGPDRHPRHRERRPRLARADRGRRHGHGREHGALVTLNINDSDDTKAHRNVTISSTQISGLAGADQSTVIGYGGGTLAALNISGSLGTGIRRDIPPNRPGRKPRPIPAAVQGERLQHHRHSFFAVDPVTTLTSNGVDSVNVMMPNSDLGGYGALVIKSPKHSTSLSVLATARRRRRRSDPTMAAARSKATGATPWRVARRPLPQSESSRPWPLATLRRPRPTLQRRPPRPWPLGTGMSISSRSRPAAASARDHRL